MLRALPAPFAWPGDGVPFRQARRFWLDPEARPPKPVVMGDLFQSRAAGGGGGTAPPRAPTAQRWEECVLRRRNSLRCSGDVEGCAAGGLLESLRKGSGAQQVVFPV